MIAYITALMNIHSPRTRAHKPCKNYFILLYALWSCSVYSIIFSGYFKLLSIFLIRLFSVRVCVHLILNVQKVKCTPKSPKSSQKSSHQRRYMFIPGAVRAIVRLQRTTVGRNKRSAATVETAIKKIDTEESQSEKTKPLGGSVTRKTSKRRKENTGNGKDPIIRRSSTRTVDNRSQFYGSLVSDVAISPEYPGISAVRLGNCGKLIKSRRMSTGQSVHRRRSCRQSKANRLSETSLNEKRQQSSVRYVTAGRRYKKMNSGVTEVLDGFDDTETMCNGSVRARGDDDVQDSISGKTVGKVIVDPPFDENGVLSAISGHTIGRKPTACLPSAESTPISSGRRADFTTSDSEQDRMSPPYTCREMCSYTGLEVAIDSDYESSSPETAASGMSFILNQLSFCSGNSDDTCFETDVSGVQKNVSALTGTFHSVERTDKQSSGYAITSYNTGNDEASSPERRRVTLPKREKPVTKDSKRPQSGSYMTAQGHIERRSELTRLSFEGKVTNLKGRFETTALSNSRPARTGVDHLFDGSCVSCDSGKSLSRSTIAKLRGHRMAISFDHASTDTTCTNDTIAGPVCKRSAAVSTTSSYCSSVFSQSGDDLEHDSDVGRERFKALTELSATCVSHTPSDHTELKDRTKDGYRPPNNATSPDSSCNCSPIRTFCILDSGASVDNRKTASNGDNELHCRDISSKPRTLSVSLSSELPVSSASDAQSRRFESYHSELGSTVNRSVLSARRSDSELNVRCESRREGLARDRSDCRRVYSRSQLPGGPNRQLIGDCITVLAWHKPAAVADSASSSRKCSSAPSDCFSKLDRDAWLPVRSERDGDESMMLCQPSAIGQSTDHLWRRDATSSGNENNVAVAASMRHQQLSPEVPTPPDGGHVSVDVSVQSNNTESNSSASFHCHFSQICQKLKTVEIARHKPKHIA